MQLLTTQLSSWQHPSITVWYYSLWIINKWRHFISFSNKNVRKLVKNILEMETNLYFLLFHVYIWVLFYQMKKTHVHWKQWCITDALMSFCLYQDLTNCYELNSIQFIGTNDNTSALEITWHKTIQCNERHWKRLIYLTVKLQINS